MSEEGGMSRKWKKGKPSFLFFPFLFLEAVVIRPLFLVRLFLSLHGAIHFGSELGDTH